MLVNENVIEQLCMDAGNARTQKARRYQMLGNVSITKVEYENENNFEIHAKVFGTEQYDTYVEVKNGEVEEIRCDCPDYYNTYGVCKHSLASVLEFNQNGFQDIKNPDIIKNQDSITRQNNKNINKYNSFHQIVKTLYNEELDEIDSDIDVELKNKGTIKIEPQIAGLMLSAIISDTLLLKSPTTTDKDKKAVEELAKIANVDISKYGLDMLKAGTDLDKYTEDELIRLDAKCIEKEEIKYVIAQVNTVSIPDVLKRKAKIEEEMNKEILAKGLSLFVFVITDIVNSNSEAIVLGDRTELISKSYEIDNDIAVMPGVVSRKKQILPLIEKNM